MRRESPLLVTGRVDDAVSNNIAAEVSANSNEASTANNDGDENQSGNENMVRNISNTRRRRSPPGIPEEGEVVVEENDEISSTQNATNNTSATAPRAGHWLAQAATNIAAARANRPTNPTRSRGSATLGLSDKQRPSHRKLRRWNNDRFVGTSSEQIHIMLESDAGANNYQYWREFYMPNYPREYRSEFSKLCTDEINFGQSVRDRFLRGEVAHSRKEEDSMWMERSVEAKFQKLGIAVEDDHMGRKLFQSLSPRIQSILSRSCALGGNDALGGLGESSATLTFARHVVAAFESYLVSLALASSKKDVTSVGYPPEQPQHVYDLFDKILSSPPKVVIRNKRQHISHNLKHLHAVSIPTIHFYFLVEDSNGSKETRQVKSSAFYRILLYAVCQFHKLEFQSSSITSKGNRRKHSNNGQATKSVKVVTVQGGVLLAPALKLLDNIDNSR